MNRGVEKLIGLVKERPFLYDCRNADFKNYDKKLIAWNEIAERMGSQTGIFWKFKWLRLKENYSKYKKSHGNPPKELYRKYQNWPWARYMRFTDNYPSRKGRNKDNRIYAEDISGTSIQDDLSISEDNFLNDERIKDKKPQLSEECPGFLTLTQNEGNVIENHIYVVQEELNEENEQPVEDIKVIIQKEVSSNSKKRKIKTDNSESLSKTVNRGHNDFDEVEHFFMSYAKTFKRLPLRHQRVLKLEMVTLFARYELMADSINANPSQ